MDLPAFAVTWDYRCPFARNAHEHLIAGLQAGAGWQVTFLPFSLSQVHVPEDGTPVWDDPEMVPDLTALAAGVVVRDKFPDRFLDAHAALFAARHDEGGDLRDPHVVRAALHKAGIPADQVFDALDDGWPQRAVRVAHEQAVAEHEVFGVPTFIVGARAAFARLMNRPEGDGALATATIERVVALIVEHHELNELKHTTIAR